MIWVRKGIVHLLATVLFISLLGGAVAMSVTVALSHPDKLENWLSQSGIYSAFVTNAIKQANNSTGSDQSGGGISLNDVAVQQAAQSAFSPTLLQQDVNTVLNSNYAWLQGKTATPNFSIDLTSAKQSFAAQVGQYVTARLASLSACTAAQLPAAAQQLQNDPLSVTCLPAGVNPTTEGTKVTQQLNNNGGFLSNPVITAQSINPNGGTNAQPYYKKLNFAPKAYRLAIATPWILVLLALLSAVGIFFIAPTKRRGIRRIAWVLTEAGVLLVAMKFAADYAFKKVESQLFNKSSIGPLQQSLTDFAHKVEHQLVTVNMYIGIVFVVVAVAVFVYLIITRGRGGVQFKAPKISGKPAKNSPTQAIANDDAAAPNSGQNAPDSTSTKPKRPRLIQ